VNIDKSECYGKVLLSEDEFILEIHPSFTVAIIQARMGSSRLPGKVLLDIGGEPMLVRVIERTCRAETLSRVMVATTDDSSDDPVAELCEKRGCVYFRGSVHDVLDRYYQAAHSQGADVIVRITADCPVIDPVLIDRTVEAFLGKTESQDEVLSCRSTSLTLTAAADPYDFAANRLPPPFHRTYPIGLDVEVCSASALDYAWEHAKEKHQREHVMPYLYETSGRFNVLLINHETDLGSLRWTVDTPEDLELLRRIYAHFGDRDDFSWLDVLDLWRKNPELFEINTGIRHKTLREIDERSGSSAV
jgi:spore coat polysaccharide biosynthesis protein SpsF